MITQGDLVQLPYTRDLTEAGLVYARGVLQNRHDPASSRLYDTLRRTAASAALNLAFRRYLGEKGISFGVEIPVPFSDPARYDLRLGGRTCELKSYLISRASQWQALSNDPRLALRALALVPLDRHTRETVRPRDVYAFGFVGAQVESKAEDGEGRSVPRDQCWMHVMPRSWRLPQCHAAMGPVILKSESNIENPIELGGKDLSGSPLVVRVQLGERQRVEVPDSLLTLSHVIARSRPSGRVGIHAAARRLTHVIQPGDWHSVWLQGWGITLLGWITREEFRTRATLIPEGRKVFQFDRTKTRNLAVAVSELKPITELMGSPGASGRIP
jgi:hypothetical protein